MKLTKLFFLLAALLFVNFNAQALGNEPESHAAFQSSAQTEKGKGQLKSFIKSYKALKSAQKEAIAQGHTTKQDLKSFKKEVRQLLKSMAPQLDLSQKIIIGLVLLVIGAILGYIGGGTPLGLIGWIISLIGLVFLLVGLLEML